MLFHKLIRDMRCNLSHFVTIFLMILIGVMVYTGIDSYMTGMSDTANKFYKDTNLMDLSVDGSFNNKEIDEIKSLDHVNMAAGKMIVTGSTDNNRTLLLNFIESNNINKFYIVNGEKFNKNRHGVWLDEFFARENNIEVGSVINIKANNISLKERVVGLINVADHVYDTKDSSELYPNKKDFGFAYMSVNEISNYTYNNIMVDVDSDKNINKVKKEIENNMSILSITRKSDLKSYRTYQGEIDEGKTYIGIFSFMFLFIAMLAVITTMTRFINKERIQIGTLKALGFSNIRVFIHYLSYGVFLSILGGFVGIIMGYYIIGRVFIGIEMSVFEIPNGHAGLTWSSFIVWGLVIIVTMIVTYFTCRSILIENPADALREGSPNIKEKSLEFTKNGIFNWLSFSSLWNIRDMIRNKLRSFMGLVGVVGCCCLIVCGFGMLDSMNYFVKLQFDGLYNFKYKLVLDGSGDLDKLEKRYGSDTSSTLGVVIKKNGRTQSNNIVVTDASNKLRFVNSKDDYINIRSNGVYITRKLASNNNYKIGDNMYWKIDGDKKYYKSKIVGFNKDPQNQNITMSRDYLESLGIEYRADSIYTNKNLSSVNSIDGVSVIQSNRKLRESMDSMLSMMRSMVWIIIFIAIILGGVIIYSLGVLSFSEKERDFATLKVLGFSDKMIRSIYIKENVWLSIVGGVIGLPVGYYLTDYLFQVAIEKHYDFNANICVTTYMVAFIGTVVVSYVVSILLSRRIKRIDMVSCLKGNE